jgi:hypothetical protein
MIGKGSRHALHHSSFFAEIHTTFREHHQNILGPKSSPFLDTSTVRSATDVLIDRPTLESNEHRQRMPIPNTHSMMMLNSGTTGIVSFPGAIGTGKGQPYCSALCWNFNLMLKLS